jgi:hypothetical protein
MSSYLLEFTSLFCIFIFLKHFQMKAIAFIVCITLITFQSCYLPMNSAGFYQNLAEDLPVVVTKKRVSPLQVEGYPPIMTIEYVSISPKHYGEKGKIKIKDAYFFMAVGVGDTLGIK